MSEWTRPGKDGRHVHHGHRADDAGDGFHDGAELAVEEAAAPAEAHAPQRHAHGDAFGEVLQADANGQRHGPADGGLGDAGTRRSYPMDRPKRERKLPNVMRQEEVKRLLEAPMNVKHRAMLLLVNSAGLRSGELLSLHPHHLERDRMLLRVEQGKGVKDRYTLLSPKALEAVDAYLLEWKPKRLLFEGQHGGPYTPESLRQVFRIAKAKAGIQRKLTLHSLRHSFATHLLEQGTDIRYIGELLGHSSVKTTEIHTHLTTRFLGLIKSPLDNL